MIKLVELAQYYNIDINDLYYDEETKEIKDGRGNVWLD